MGIRSFFRVPAVQTIIALAIATAAGFSGFRWTGRLVLNYAVHRHPGGGEAAVTAGIVGIFVFAVIVAIVYPLVLWLLRELNDGTPPEWQGRRR
jgi:hypothetical protein